MIIPHSFLRDIVRQLDKSVDTRENKQSAYTRDTLLLLSNSTDFSIEDSLDETIVEITNTVQSVYRISAMLDTLLTFGSSSVSSALSRLDDDYHSTTVADHQTVIREAISGYFSTRNAEDIANDFVGFAGFQFEPDFTKEIIENLNEGSSARFLEVANEALAILDRFEPSMTTVEAVILETRDNISDTSGFGTVGNDRQKTSAAGVSIGFDGNDTLLGNSGDNDLRGGYGRDKLVGRGGDDSLDGGYGADLIRGGGGRDLLSGSAGKDKILGNGGADLIYGGAGNDSLFGGGGNDTLNGSVSRANSSTGEHGDFRFSGSSATQKDILVGGGGRDTFQFVGPSGKGTIKDFRLNFDEIEVLNLDVFIPGAFRLFPSDNARLIAERPDQFVLRQKGDDASLKYDGSRAGTRKFEVIIEDLDVSRIEVSDLFFA